MLHLPPLCPIADARLELPLSEQLRRLGRAGFPLVWFRGLGGEAEWNELRLALEGSAANGGWPGVCVEGDPGLAARAVEAGLTPWGLHLSSAGVRRPPDPASLRLGVSLSSGSLEGGAWDYVRIEHIAEIGTLRDRGIAPVVLAGFDTAAAWYEAGVEALAEESPLSGDLSARLWEAQRLRWQARPPIRRGQGLALVGGSGCGKSTLARLLGRRLGLPSADLDEVVARRAGKAIPRIFAEDGEAAFRRMETEVTCEAFAAPAVLALGGGAWESGAVREAALGSGFAVLWIAEDPDRVWRRIARDPGRPLAQDRRTFMERWRTRTPCWMEAPMLLPLGRDAAGLAETLADACGI